MASGVENCSSGTWYSLVPPGEMGEAQRCRGELEQQLKRPMVVQSKCFTAKGDRTCGVEVVPDANCGPDGGSFDYWFAAEHNVTEAQRCSEKLRALGYKTHLEIHARFVIAASASVVVDGGPEGAQDKKLADKKNEGVGS